MINQRKIGIVLSYLNTAFGCIIPIFYTPIMLQLLGVAQHGVYGVAQSIISYLGIFSLGMGSTVVRYIMKYKNDVNKANMEKIIGLFICIYSCLSILVCLGGLFLSGFSEIIFDTGLTSDELSQLKLLIVLMTFSIPFSFFSSVYSAVIFAYEKFIYSYILNIVTTVLTPILNLIVLYNGLSSIGIVVVSLFISFITLLINRVFCNRCLNVKASYRSLPIHLIKEIFSFSVVVLISTIADMLFWATDKVLIGAMLGSVYVSIYNIGNTFTSLFQTLSSTISHVFGPEVNSLVFQNKPISDNSRLMIKVGRIQFLILSLVISGFIVFGKQFMLLWVGETYIESFYIGLCTMLPLIIPLIENVAFTTITAMNKHQFRSYVYIVIAICNAISTYLIIPIYGIVGAAICTAISYVVGHGIILNWYYYKVIHLDIIDFFKNIISLCKIPVFMVLINIFFINKLFSYNNLLLLFNAIVIYTLIYCVLSWIFSMNDYEKGLIKDIFSKLFRRII